MEEMKCPKSVQDHGDWAQTKRPLHSRYRTECNGTLRIRGVLLVTVQTAIANDDRLGGVCSTSSTAKLRRCHARWSFPLISQASHSCTQNHRLQLLSKVAAIDLVNESQIAFLHRQLQFRIAAKKRGESEDRQRRDGRFRGGV